MKKIVLGLLTSLLSFTSMQAFCADTHPVYAYVYNDSAKIKYNHPTDFGGILGYPTGFQVFFNSVKTKNFFYNKKTGELQIPKSGYYEATYSVAPNDQGTRFMSLGVNGYEVQPSRITLAAPFFSLLDDTKILRPVTTTTFVLHLNRYDRVSLLLPNIEGLLKNTQTIFARYQRNQLENIAGHSVSLYLKKL